MSTKEIQTSYREKFPTPPEVENPSSLARTIAWRNFHEYHANRHRLAELTGDRYVRKNFAAEEFKLHLSLLTNENLLTSPFILREYQDSALTPDLSPYTEQDEFAAVINYLHNDEENPLPITGIQIRIATGESKIATDSKPVPVVHIIGGSRRTIYQARYACEIGMENGVDPAHVFDDEKLYTELIRRSYTPEEIAQLGIDAITRITPEKLQEITFNLAQKMDKVGGEPEDPEVIQGLLLEISEEFDSKEKAEMKTAQYKKALGQLTMEQIIRFWGQEEWEDLPDSIRGQLITS